jgi:hypothetical protein
MYLHLESYRFLILLKYPTLDTVHTKESVQDCNLYCDGIWSFDRQRLSKHCLNAEIIAEVEVIFARQRLDKHLFQRQRMLTKAFPWKHNRTEEMFDMVNSIPADEQI